MKISVVIPIHNEEGFIGRTVQHVLQSTDIEGVAEVIVVDSASIDRGVQEAKAAGAHVVVSPIKGRSPQMNVGASHATGEVLYFLHADTLPPAGFSRQIVDALERGADAGCMRMCFDKDHWALRVKCWFTRFSASGLHYGDQSLFVRRELFQQLSGFEEDMSVFEDLDIIERIKRSGTFEVLDGPITTSARKYDQNGYLRMQLAFYAMYPMYRLGYSQATLTKTYKHLVRQDKL